MQAAKLMRTPTVVAQHFKRFGGLFESRNRLVVARILVGMKLDRQLVKYLALH